MNQRGCSSEETWMTNWDQVQKQGAIGSISFVDNLLVLRLETSPNGSKRESVDKANQPDAGGVSIANKNDFDKLFSQSLSEQEEYFVAIPTRISLENFNVLSNNSNAKKFFIFVDDDLHQQRVNSNDIATASTPYQVHENYPNSGNPFSHLKTPTINGNPKIFGESNNANKDFQLQNFQNHQRSSVNPMPDFRYNRDPRDVRTNIANLMMRNNSMQSVPHDGYMNIESLRNNTFLNIENYNVQVQNRVNSLRLDLGGFNIPQMPLMSQSDGFKDQIQPSKLARALPSTSEKLIENVLRFSSGVSETQMQRPENGALSIRPPNLKNFIEKYDQRKKPDANRPFSPTANYSEMRRKLKNCFLQSSKNSKFKSVNVTSPQTPQKSNFQNSSNSLQSQSRNIIPHRRLEKYSEQKLAMPDRGSIIKPESIPAIMNKALPELNNYPEENYLLQSSNSEITKTIDKAWESIQARRRSQELAANFGQCRFNDWDNVERQKVLIKDKSSRGIQRPQGSRDETFPIVKEEKGFENNNWQNISNIVDANAFSESHEIYPVRNAQPNNSISPTLWGEEANRTYETRSRTSVLSHNKTTKDKKNKNEKNEENEKNEKKLKNFENKEQPENQENSEKKSFVVKDPGSASEETVFISSTKLREFKMRRKPNALIDQMERTIPCPYCKKLFKRNAHVMSHLRTHSINKVMFPCRYCDAEFSFMSGKRRHEKTHTGESIVHCEVCGKTFYRTHRLNAHRLKYHPETLF